MKWLVVYVLIEYLFNQNIHHINVVFEGHLLTLQLAWTHASEMKDSKFADSAPCCVLIALVVWRCWDGTWETASLRNMAQRITHVTLIQCVFCVNDLNAGLGFQDYSCPHMSGCLSQFGKFDLTWKVCLVPQNRSGVRKLQRDWDGGQIVKKHLRVNVLSKNYWTQT